MSTIRTTRARVARRTVGALTTAVLVGMTMAGCGVTADSLTAGPVADPGAPPADRFEAAIKATEAEVRYSLDATLTVDLVQSSEEIHVSASVDRGSAPRLVALYDVADIEAELRLDGDDAWFSSNTPEFEDAVPDDAEWIHVTRDDDVDGIDFDSPDDVGAGSVYFLRGAEDVEDLGVDGEGDDRVWTYSFTAAPDVAERAPEEHRETVRDLFHASDNLDITVTGEVDIDAKGRIRRLQLHGALTAKDLDDLSAGIAERGGLDFEIRYDRFGEAVDVEPPPDDETVDAADDPALLEAVAIQTA